MRFDIDQFYDYYSNISNLDFDTNNPNYTYFDNTIGKWINKKKMGYYVPIYGKKVYVEILDPVYRKNNIYYRKFTTIR